MSYKYVLYKFNEKTEYKTYLRVGKQYIKQCKGKKIKNNKKYPNLNNYNEWKEYFINNFLSKFSNHDDFKHYLNAVLRINQSNLEILKTIALPIYVALISILLTVCTTSDCQSWIKIVVSIVIVCIVSFQMFMVHKLHKKINFLDDCIDIVTNHKK